MSTSPKTVLVTGGNGYLGSATVLHFLEHGYRVHATVRSLAKADGLKGYLYPKYQSALSFFVVEDMTKDGVYERAGALKGVDAICHVASPVPDIAALAPADAASGADWVRDMVRPAIEGTLTILRAATASPQVRHIAVTSSIAAMQSFTAFSTDPKAKEAHITEANWNESTEDEPGLKDHAFAAYFASKACAERAAFAYVETEKPHWTLSTFCPPMFLGPAAIKPKTAAEFGSTLGLFYTAMQGKPTGFPFDGSFVDVRDIAQAFRLAIEKPLSNNERFLLCSGAQTNEECVAFATSGDASVLKERPSNYDASKARTLLGWKPHTKTETFVAMRSFLKEAEKAFTQ